MGALEREPGRARAWNHEIASVRKSWDGGERKRIRLKVRERRSAGVQVWKAVDPELAHEGA